MAGIGFELKKLFSQKGVFAIIRAYGYASIVSAGPMILGIILLLGVRILANIGGANIQKQDLLISMITYTLLASLLLTNIFSMVTTRYIADAIYMNKFSLIMPSFYGSVSVALLVGSLLYGSFLTMAGIPFSYQLLCFILFGELVVVWTQMNYLTAIKDYRSILVTFLIATIIALLIGYGMVYFQFPVIVSLLLAVSVAYGIMMVWFYSLLMEYFPEGEGSPLVFLKWFDQYPGLGSVGILTTLGMFLHLIIMWFSPIGIIIQGLFRAAPQYDVPALFAFLSTLVTTVNFVTSVEVNFYPKYKKYFGLYNEGGILADINQAEEEMKSVLYKELGYTFAKQFFSTMLFIILGTLMIPRMPLGFNIEMLGIYRVLCVGYALYAIGNSTMLISLYFSDTKGAYVSSLLFVLSSFSLTLIFLEKGMQYYGFGFLIGGIVYCSVSLYRLMSYLRDLTYNVLASQPMVVERKRGVCTRFSERMENKYNKKFGGVGNEEIKA